MALPLLPNVDEWELRGGGEDSFGALEGLSLDDGFLMDMLDDTGTSFGADMPPTSGGGGGFGPGGGGASVASYALRCIDESHPLDCSRCVLARGIRTVGPATPAHFTQRVEQRCRSKSDTPMLSQLHPRARRPRPGGTAWRQGPQGASASR